jgi:hypothetical protein
LASAEIRQLLASPIHRYVGRPDDGPEPAPPGEIVACVEIRAGLGIVGDRYFGKTAHRDASITLIAAENLPLRADLVQTRETCSPTASTSMRSWVRFSRSTPATAR